MANMPGVDEYKYTVVRHTTDHDGVEDTEVKCTYSTLAEANEAARTDLSKECGRNFFVGYKVRTKADGSIEVKAEFRAGGIMTVFVQKTKAPRNPAPERSPPSLQSSTSSSTVASRLPGFLYIVIFHKSEDHHDEDVKMELADNTVYESLFMANLGARKLLAKACGLVSEDELGTIGELVEDNKNSRSKPYSGCVYHPNYDYYSLKAEVQQMRLKRDPQSQNLPKQSTSSAPRPSKRPRGDADGQGVVIDLSD